MQGLTYKQALPKIIRFTILPRKTVGNSTAVYSVNVPSSCSFIKLYQTVVNIEIEHVGKKW